MDIRDNILFCFSPVCLNTECCMTTSHLSGALMQNLALNIPSIQYSILRAFILCHLQITNKRPIPIIMFVFYHLSREEYCNSTTLDCMLKMCLEKNKKLSWVKVKYSLNYFFLQKFATSCHGKHSVSYLWM